MTLMKTSWLRRLGNRLSASTPPQPRRRRGVRPLLEILEDRTVPSTIQGVVFHDLDGNGIQDAGESGMANVQVFLDSNGNGAFDEQTFTASDGTFSFTGLADGTYPVMVVLPDGFTETGAASVNGPGSGVLGEIRVDFESPEPGRTPDGRINLTGVAWANGAMYVSHLGSRDVADDTHMYQVDPATGAVIGDAVVIPDAIAEITFDGTHFWGANNAANSIIRFNFAGEELARYQTGTNLNSLVWAMDSVWVLDNVEKALHRFDPASGESGSVTQTIQLPNSQLTGVGFDGRHFWVNDRTTDLVFEVDPLNGDVLRSFAAPGDFGYGLGFDGQFLWLTDHELGRVFQYDIGAPSPAQIVTVSGDDVVDVNFGLAALGSVSGIVFNDMNANGVRDAGEVGLEQRHVYLDTNGNGRFEPWERSVLTGPDGSYSLGSLRPGVAPLNLALLAPGSSTPSPLFLPVDGSGTALEVDFGNPPNAVGPVGTETLVNMTTEGAQGNFTGWPQVQSVAMDSQGNYVVVWESASAEDPDGGIIARLFHANGMPRTDEFRVNGVTEGLQRGAVAAMDAKGNFVVAWSTPDSSTGNRAAFARVFNANGSARTGDLQVTAYSRNSTRYVTSVAMDADGDFVVLMMGSNKQGATWNRGLTYFQRFNAQGQAQGDITLVADANITIGISSVAMDALGNFVVAWGDSGDGATIFAQRYDRAGQKAGEVLAPQLPGYQPNVAQNAAGDFVIASSGMAQLYSADGVAQGTVLNYGPSEESRPGLAMDDNGTVVFTKNSESTQRGNIVARRYIAGHLEDAFFVNTTISGRQERSSVAMTPTGNFVISWQGNGIGDDSGVFVQRYAAPAAPGISVTPTSPLTVKQGESVSFDVALHTQPTDVVIFLIEIKNESGAVVYSETITFDPAAADWNLLQSVTIDLAGLEVGAYSIAFTSESADPNYDGLTSEFELLIEASGGDGGGGGGNNGGGKGGGPKK